MLWHEWLMVILFISYFQAFAVYAFIGVMDKLFPSPNIFDKQIYKICNRFRACKRCHSKEKPWNRRVFTHNVASYSKKGYPEYSEQENQKRSKTLFTHKNPQQ
ncbi:hypothetical protein ACFLVH_05510 [Chloroflexota bacterium]